MFIFFYLIRYIVISVALGLCFPILNLNSNKKKVAHFLLGCSLAPLMIASADYLLGILFPGKARYLIMFLPFILAILLLIKKRKMICEAITSLRRITKQQGSCARGKFLVKVVIVIFLCSTFFVSIKITGRKIFDTDIAHYLVQAKYFANDTISLEIDNYSGDKAGTVFADDHGPLWPVFLGDAWICSGSDDNGYWNDDIVRIAIVLCFFSFLIALMGLSLVYQNNVLIAFVSPAVFLGSTYAYLLTIGSREAFRFIPLCVLLALFNQLIEERNLQKIFDNKIVAMKSLTIIAFISFLTMQGHGSNVFLIASLLLVFDIVMLIKRVKFSSIISISLSVSIGIFFGFLKNINLYLTIGSFRHNTSSVAKGTIFYEIYSKYINEVQSLKNAVKGYGITEWAIIFSGIIGLVIIVYICKKMRDKELFYRVLLIVSMLLPLTGVFNILQNDVSTWFLVQLRYRMYIYILIAMVLNITIDLIYSYKKATACILVAMVCTLTTMNILVTWVRRSAIDFIREEVTTGIIETTKLAEYYGGDRKIVIDNQRMAYYFNRQPQLIIHEESKPLLRANTEQEIKQAINDLGIKVFICSVWKDPGIDEMPYYKYIINEANTDNYKVISSIGKEYNIYVIK